MQYTSLRKKSQVGSCPFPTDQFWYSVFKTDVEISRISFHTHNACLCSYFNFDSIACMTQFCFSESNIQDKNVIKRKVLFGTVVWEVTAYDGLLLLFLSLQTGSSHCRELVHLMQSGRNQHKRKRTGAPPSPPLGGILILFITNATLCC